MYEYAKPLVIASNAKFAANIIDSTFESGAADQYKRELVTNAIEAGATEVRVTAYRFAEFGPEGGIKAAFVDNGEGMSGQKIPQYLTELGSGKKEISPSGNFNMGARVSTLPFNHYGVAIASWVEDDEEGSLVWLAYDDESGTYQVVGFGENNVQVSVPTPEMKHPIIAKAGHGTVVFLLGSREEDHTVGDIRRQPDGSFLYPGVRYTHEDRHYLNAKYFTLPEDVTIKTMWSNQHVELVWKKKIAPGSWYDDVPTVMGDKDAGIKGEAWGFKSVDGLAKIIAKDCNEVYDPENPDWDKGYSGTVLVEDSKGYKAKVHWALMAANKFQRAPGGGGGSDTRDYGIPLGLFGELYQDEVYNLTTTKELHALRASLERYGIIKAEIRDRLILLVEPEATSTVSLVARPSASRSRLERGNEGLPHVEWGDAFACNLPDPIADRIKFLDAPDADYESAMKKLLERLRHVFTRRIKSNEPTDTKATVKPTSDEDDNTVDGDQGDQPTVTKDDPKGIDIPRDHPGGCVITVKRKPRKKIGGGAKNVEHDATRPHSAPNPGNLIVRWDGSGEEFQVDGVRGMLVHWIGGTARTAYINGAHPFLKDLVDTAVSERPQGKQEEARKLAQEALRQHVAAQILCVEMLAASSLAGDDSALKREEFKAKAISDEGLSAVLANEPSVRAVINRAYQGRTGFQRRATKAA